MTEYGTDGKRLYGSLALLTFAFGLPRGTDEEMSNLIDSAIAENGSQYVMADMFDMLTLMTKLMADATRTTPQQLLEVIALDIADVQTGVNQAKGIS